MRFLLSVAVFAAVAACGGARECASQFAGTWFMDDTFAQASSQFCTDLARNRSPTNVGTITRSGADYLYSEGLNVETIETDGSTCTAKTVLTRTESSSTGQLIIERHLSFWSTYVDGWVVIQTTGPDGTVCTADFTTHGRHAGSVN